jgi:hypothetical protein
MPRILVITANSRTTPLQLSEEVRGIQEALGEQTYFRVTEVHEGRAQDLIKKLLDEKPEILHFAGHGQGGAAPSLTLKGDEGQDVPLTQKWLCSILDNIPVRPQLLVLNACFSASLAAELKKRVGVIIGAEGKIEDGAARRFARNLYAALGESSPVRNAFELARAAFATSGYDPEQLKIDHLPGTDPSAIVFRGRPELMAEFVLGSDDGPLKARGEYRICLWLRGVDQMADSVTFQVCHDSFDPPYNFWEVTRSESSTFLTDDFRSSGDVTIRATVWSRDRGVGIEGTLGEALRRKYGDKAGPAVRRAISAIAAA